MPKYEVSVLVSGNWSDVVKYEVEADNDIQARKKATEMAYEDDSIYPTTEVASANVEEVVELDDDCEEEPSDEDLDSVEDEEEDFDDDDDLDEDDEDDDFDDDDEDEDEEEDELTFDDDDEDNEWLDEDEDENEK